MILALVSSAFAMCAAPDADMVPADGAVDVPVDVAILWTTSFTQDDADPVLIDAHGAEVPVTMAWFETAGSARYAVLTPETELLPEGAYSVTDGRVTYAFTTGVGGASVDPEVPSVAAVEADADYAERPTCDGLVSWQEDREHVVVDLDVASPVAGYVEARVRVDDGEEFSVRGDGGGVRLAWRGCYQTNLPDMEGAWQIHVALRAVSYDGQVSAWGDEQTVAIPWPEAPDCARGSGCATGPHPAWAGGLLAAMLALGGRARRR